MSFLIGPLVGGLASAGASKLFGGSSKAASFQPQMINAGGLSSTRTGNTIGVTPSADRLGLVSGTASTYLQQADALKGLRASVTPGYSALRSSQLTDIENARQSAMGNLRDNLARRRVLGSSFAQDSLARADIGFAQQREKVQADTFMQELDATTQLVNAEFTARTSAFKTSLDELNLEASTATSLASSASSQLSANAQTKAQLDAQAAAGAGKFFQPTIDGISKGATNYFNPPAASDGLSTGSSLY